MDNLLFKYSNVIPVDTKVIFDTNAYRNFVERYLTADIDFYKAIEAFKSCEKEASFIPSSNLLSVMELYQHLQPEDPAYDRCKKAILFSFNRSCIDKHFNHQPLSEIEISDRLFGKISDGDMQLNGYLLDGHVRYCVGDDRFEHSNIEFAKNVSERLEAYKETSYNSIINNLQRLFSSFSPETLKFSNEDYEKYKTKFGKNRLLMYVNLGITLFETFQKRSGITNYEGDKDLAIVNLISDYQPALFSYIKIWENFSNNNANSKSPFRPNKNDLIDSFILFSIVPDDNILLVTDEKKIHSIFKEVDKPNSVISLSNYLTKIKFNTNSNQETGSTCS